MQCKNCGIELNENEKFCGKCGAQVELNAQVISNNDFQSPIANCSQDEGKLVIKFIAVGILQLIMLILRFVDFGKYHVSIKDLTSDGGTYSLNKIMGSSAETAIFVILLLISVAFCALPILKNTLNKRRRMVLSKIVSFWNVLIIILGISALADCVSSNKESITENYGAEFFSGSWNLTFGGWLNVIITIATIVLLFMISISTKKYSKNNCFAKRPTVKSQAFCYV